jgi:hypothetical protein
MEAMKTLDQQKVFILRTVPPGPVFGLHNYIFTSEKHAREWLSQGFVTDDDYRVAIGTAKRRSCCGERYAIKIFHVMKPSEFLIQTPEMG